MKKHQCRPYLPMETSVIYPQHLITILITLAIMVNLVPRHFANNSMSLKPAASLIQTKLTTSPFHFGSIWFRYYHREKDIFFLCWKPDGLVFCKLSLSASCSHLGQKSHSTKQPLTLQLNSSVNTL